MTVPITSRSKHPDCEDRCQLREHKGYDSCSRSGECAYLDDALRKPPASEGRSTESSLHAFTLRDAIKDGLPPDTALVHWSDALALEMRLRHAPSATGMTEERAREILEGTVQPGGALYCAENYLSWGHGNRCAKLDGDFSADDLEAVAFWMRRPVDRGNNG